MDFTAVRRFVVQDEASSVVWGMLGSVANSGKGRSSGILASNGRLNYRSSQAILDLRFEIFLFVVCRL